MILSRQLCITLISIIFLPPPLQCRSHEYYFELCLLHCNMHAPYLENISFMCSTMLVHRPCNRRTAFVMYFRSFSAEVHFGMSQIVHRTRNGNRQNILTTKVSRGNHLWKPLLYLTTLTLNVK